MAKTAFVWTGCVSVTPSASPSRPARRAAIVLACPAVRSQSSSVRSASSWTATNRVFIAHPGDQALGQLRGELAVGGLRAQELHTRDRLGSAALVDVEMGRAGADRRLPRAAGGPQRQDVRGGAAPYRVGARVFAEVLAEP